MPFEAIHTVSSSDPDAFGEEENRRPASVNNGNAASAPPDAQVPFGVRMREASLSPRPFLLSSGTAWATLDFVVALSVAAAVGGGLSRFPLSAQLSGACLRSGLPFALYVLVLANLTGLYRADARQSTFLELLRILRAVFLAGLGLYALEKLWQTAALSKRSILYESAFTAIAMFLGRMLWKRHRSRLYQREIAVRDFLIVGVDDVGRDVRTYLASSSSSGYRFRGFVPLGEPTDDQTGETNSEIVGDIQNVVAIARANFVDEIIFSRRPATPGVLSRVLHQAQSLGISIRLIPSLTETLIDRTDVQYIGDLPTITVFHARQRPFSLLVKRAIDIVGASAASVILLPLFGVIAIAIKLQSPGPVLYLSKRVGHKGRVFTCYKFRTMIDKAAQMQDKLSHLNERKEVLFKISKDPRVTTVGAFLRKYSLDELPQLWNVLRGDMSLVGPRPSISSEVAQYETAHLRRLDAVPGITGLWQVEARQDPSFENYINLDSKYVNHWSLGLDLSILVRTVKAVLRGTGS